MTAPPKLVQSPTFSSGLGLLALRLLGIGLGFLTTVILAQYLGAERFGLHVTLQTWGSLLALPLTMGLPTLLVREVAAGLENREYGRVRGILRWSLRIVLSGFLLLLGVSLLAGLLVGPVMGLTTCNNSTTQLAALGLLFVACLALLERYYGILNGLSYVATASLLESGVRQLGFVALIAACWMFFAPSVLISVSALVSATAIACVASSVVTQRLIPLEAKQAEPDGRSWIAELAPFTAISAIQVFRNHTDIATLSALASTSDVAVYKIAAQVVVVPSIVMNIIGRLSAPRVAAAFAANEVDRLRSILVRGARFMFTFSVTFIVAFGLVGESVLGWVFGLEYRDAYGLILILSVGAIYSTGCGLVTTTLNMTNQSRTSARLALLSAVSNVSLNLALVPFFGATGAAFSTVVSQILMQFLASRAAHQSLGFRIDALATT